MSNRAIHQASWIWAAGVAGPHRYVCFRRSFELAAAPRGAFVEIAADSDFVLYVNGFEVGRGQFSDYPQDKTFSRFAVGKLLAGGPNTLAVLAYHRGEDFSDHRAGRPGLIAALHAGRQNLLTDAAWRAAPHPAFTPGPVERVTGQMGFVTCFDARKDEPFASPAFDDSSWPAAEVLAPALGGFWRSLSPRPVPPLQIGPPLDVAVAAQGSFTRAGEQHSVARTMSLDSLLAQRPLDVFDLSALPREGGYSGPPPRMGSLLGPGPGLVITPPPLGATGRYLIIDLGREEVGLLHLEIDAPAGAVLDIGHGEHLDDGRVRTWIGGRNFADRYICRQGPNAYTLPFRRLGCRYIELHTSNFDRPLVLRRLTLRPASLPLDRGGAFETADPLVARTHAVGVRTLELCMHEHYEDCPWREQSLYAYDSRNQALFGYYAFGNYDFAAASFDLLGRGIRDDGLLELCAPARVRITIPIFSFVWIAAAMEHWLYSGQGVLFERFSRQMDDMLAAAFARLDGATGLYRPPDAKDQWHFYEWTPGLAGLIGGDSLAGQHHALYNLYLLEAIRSLAQMHAWARIAGISSRSTPVRAVSSAGVSPASTGGVSPPIAVSSSSALTRRADALAAAINRNFWDARRGLYATVLRGRKREGLHEHVQVLALHQGIAPAGRAKSLLAALRQRSLTPMTLSSLPYMVRALMARGPAARQLVADTLDRYWQPMVLAGATSFWETQFGGDDFDYAGSLCHGWSALPVLYHQAYILGIRPLAPGFARFLISPFPSRLSRAAGTIPTPAGPIRLSWTRTPSGLDITLRGPRSLSPELLALPESPIARATYNGKVVGSQSPVARSR